MIKSSQTKRNKKLRKLVIFSTLSAIILVASTYAWFIGTQTVSVAPFDVEIAAIDGLTLSLDGKRFYENVSINSTNFNDDVDTVYVGHTNTWGNGGLKPVSSVGEIDPASSRLKLFEKSSLTSTKGGYRLMASRIPNDETAGGEYKGYVAFDLFVRNLSGTAYFAGPSDILNEEAIYLTNDSEVKVSNNGGVKDSGIENSVRVAFAQIGRVEAFRDGNVLDDEEDEDAIALIRGIACGTPATGVTAICANRPATIWEPNDTKHVANSINHYNKSCRMRVGADVFAPAAYTANETTNCMAVVDGLYSPTYSIAAAISNASAVDVYDGAGYNKYAGSVVARDGDTGEIESGYLEYPSNNIITDTAKFQEGTNRPEFIRLAPNSITKIRVYIYLEGQDIDNYDFSAVGQKISVAFGFTKQRYTEADTDYNGPAVNEGSGPAGSDKTAPVITFGSLTSSYTIAEAQALTEEELYFPLDDVTPLITATDLTVTTVDPYTSSTVDLTEDITYEGIVNVNVAGTYTVVYKVKDLAGNLGTKVRQVTVTE